MKNVVFVFSTLLICIVAGETLHAQIPRTLSYQGVLTDNAGKPRPDGSYTFTFRFYTSPTGGTAIWSESKSLPMKNGLFSTVLGEQTPFGAAVKFDKQYWLGIQVGSEPELSLRIALTSVGYSFSSLRADTASVSVASLADTTWRHSGANIYRMNGNVGIGTTQPGQKLVVNGNFSATGAVYANDEFQKYVNTQGTKTHTKILRGYLDNIRGNGTGAAPIELTIGNEDFYTYWAFKTFHGGGGSDVTEDMRIYAGNVGIDTTNPVCRLDLGTNNGVSFRLNPGTATGFSYNGFAHNDLLIGGYNKGNGYSRTFISFGFSQDPEREFSIGSADRADFPNASFTPHFTIRSGGNIGIGTTSPTSKLHVEGTTTTKVLTITGGSDLAEPFEISENQPIPKGALVIIDEENPGQLKLSHQAYDKRVAGVISGAGGINPGLTLTQEGVLEGGQNVALTGRVYALATAANGPIKPGDLLTTSEVPGHAMKATDRELWPGAVIGKAMSSLENGEGLVLVLVNLQ